MNKAVAVVIENQKGQILLVQRGPDTRDEHYKWENCGGEVEPGEDKETAIKREAMEEIGCEMEILDVLFQDNFQTASGAKWDVTIFKGKIKKRPKLPNKNHIASARWFNKKELKNVDLTTYTRMDFEKFGWI